LTDLLERPRELKALTQSWGSWEDVSLYLDRCQVDTPDSLVRATWSHVAERRPKVGLVLDFGAGDGRFARHGVYDLYRGYEIDASRCETAVLPHNARLLKRCAFEVDQADADLCIGNPPFVRNQDLPAGWRQHASDVLQRRTGVHVSGLANAWQYFFLLALASCKDDGLCALVVPYEWVSRPSAKALRDYVYRHKWGVSVYRLVDTTFDSVLTTSSITIVDKRDSSGAWRFYEETADGAFEELPSASGGVAGVTPYLRRSGVAKNAPRAVRGLSPGTQKVFVLTEAERARLGLKPGRDVQRCVTTLRHLGTDTVVLDETTFNRVYREAGHRCWLISPEAALGGPLRAYLDSVDPAAYATATCLERETWWRFVMPETPVALLATCFKGRSPKAVLNVAGTIAVGGVAGIHQASADWATGFLRHLSTLDLATRIVPQANGLLKIESGQLNTLIDEYDAMAADG
jgi:hypothetical protein